MTILKINKSLSHTRRQTSYVRYPGSPATGFSSRFSLVGFFLSLFILAVLVVPVTGTPSGGGKEKQKKFQVDLFGGFSIINPADLNLIPAADSEFRDFNCEQNLNRRYNNVSSTITGEYKKMQSAIPLGFRVKYRLNRVLSLSAGFQTLSGTRDSTPDFSCSTERSSLSRSYSTYRLSVKGALPSLGIHLEKSFTQKTDIEGFLSAGVIFARCAHHSQWNSTYLVSYPGYSEPIPVSELDALLEEKGNGTGAALEAGLRLNYRLGKRFGLFMESTYAYRVISNIKGDGREVRDGSEMTWNGQWAIKQDNLSKSWGETTMEYPTNFWNGPDGEERRIGDFKLDLSGFQLKIGFFFRF
ncbi:MAG: hypothetical protein GY757_17915 [bacterium]|nr:hypothetical protein [bacterium]